MHDACAGPSQQLNVLVNAPLNAALNVVSLRARETNYILYVLELSCAAYCNLIGAWKFLNGDKPDVISQTLSLSLDA